MCIRLQVNRMTYVNYQRTRLKNYIKIDTPTVVQIYHKLKCKLPCNNLEIFNYKYWDDYFWCVFITSINM